MPIYLTIQLKHIGKNNRWLTAGMIKTAYCTVSGSKWHHHSLFKGLYLQLVETAHPVALHKGYTLKDNQ